MAKRHTAAQKLATKQKKEATEATVKRRARAASRLAHLLAPEEMPIENELKLKRLATKGGASFCSKHASAQLALQRSCAIARLS